MSIHNFKKYKESKIVLPHLEGILQVLNLTERSLTLFSYYLPVAKILIVLREQKSIIESYKQEYEIVKKNKGIKNEQT